MIRSSAGVGEEVSGMAERKAVFPTARQFRKRHGVIEGAEGFTTLRFATCHIPALVPSRGGPYGPPPHRPVLAQFDAYGSSLHRFAYVVP